MALLSVEKRKLYFEKLKLGEYNKENIKKLQKKYLRKKDVDGIYGPDTDRLLRHIYNVETCTENFAPEEFKCECGGRHCTGYPSFMKRVELKNLQKIRSHYGKPMTVTCGLRCKGYNAECKGSITNSLHLSGYATDFYISGVTDTLANRKKSIKWMKKLENTHYIYGDGINSYGYYVHAPYMGNAMHYDTSVPKKTKKTQGVKTEKESVKEIPVENKIAKLANTYAYSSNTKKADYNGGSAKKVYTDGLNQAYPDRSSWGTAPKKGASCDVFVGTCVRNAGVDKSFPRGLDEQISYLQKSTKFKEVSVTPDTVRDGDIIVYAKKGGGAHICIAYGGKIKEAGYRHYYPKTTNYLKTRLSKTGKKWLRVYRAIAESWVENANAWAKKIADDNSYHYVLWTKNAKTHECPICHNHPKGEFHGWNCIGFAFAVWHHGGGLKNNCNCHVISNGVGEKMLNSSAADALAIAKNHLGITDIKVICNKNGIPKSKWKAGDICLMFSGNTYNHTFYYMGDGKVADSTGSSGKVPNNKEIGIRDYKNYSAKIIIRYTGK